jgi:hypothetical protein
MSRNGKRRCKCGDRVVLNAKDRHSIMRVMSIWRIEERKDATVSHNLASVLILPRATIYRGDVVSSLYRVQVDNAQT